VRIVAFSTEAAPVPRILTYIGEPAEPPRISLSAKPRAPAQAKKAPLALVGEG
jgi:hypothetical protein